MISFKMTLEEQIKPRMGMDITIVVPRTDSVAFRKEVRSVNLNQTYLPGLTSQEKFWRSGTQFAHVCLNLAI
jgi:hypothetical protein